MYLQKDDVHEVLRRLPSQVKVLIKDRGLFLAGGFIRAVVAGERPSDIDLFGTTSEQMERAATHYRVVTGGTIGVTENACTVYGTGFPVQFITAWTAENLNELLECFDFTISQAAMRRYKNRGWFSLVSKDFYPDLAARRLRYTGGGSSPGGSILRTAKFLRKGYRISPEHQASLLGDLYSNIDFSDTDSSEDLVNRISAKLREVDPLDLPQIVQ